MSRFTDRKYVICQAGKLGAVDFSQVMQPGPDYLRWNREETKFILKYKGAQPDFLAGETELTHAEITAEIAADEWQGDLPE